MRVLVLLGGLLGVLLAHQEARADCAIPRWIGTASGTAVPFVGSLYVYDESLGWGDDGRVKPLADVSWEGGKAGDVTYTRVGDTVVRLDYVGFPGTTLKVQFPWDETYSYPLVQSWRPATRAPRVLHTWHHVSSWACSSTDTLMIQIDQRVAAVRAVFTYRGPLPEASEDDYVREVILPARAERSKVVIELGKINCGSASIDPEYLRRGGKLELWAIRFDGSEAKIEGLPDRVATGEMPDDERGIDGAFTLVSTDAPAAAAKLPSTPRWIPFAALLLLGGAVIIGWRLAARSGNGCSSALR
jgi:hypothetical protein